MKLLFKVITYPLLLVSLPLLIFVMLLNGDSPKETWRYSNGAGYINAVSVGLSLVAVGMSILSITLRH